MTISLCLFGSVARGQTDEQSDKDVLVVCDDPTSIPADVEKSWADEGWSPTYYSWPNLLRRAVQGDLFIQHLKQDGIIVEDPSGQLAQLFRDFAPRADYTDEAARAMIILRVADRQIANDWMGAMICHAIYKFVRFGFSGLVANHKLYPTDYGDMLRVFSDVGAAFTADEMQALLALKDIQRSYESRKQAEADTRKVIETAKRVMTRLFEFEFFDIPADSEARLLKPYSTIREIEARIVASHSPIEMDKGELLPDIWKLVKNPRGLGWATDSDVKEDVLESINAAIATAQN